MLEGMKVLLRSVEGADAERVQRWVNEAGGPPWMAGIPGAFSRKSQEMALERLGAGRDPSTRVFAIETTDARHIGLVWLSQVDWVDRRARTGLLIGEPDYRGRGYEEDALRLLQRFAFRQMNINRLEAWVPESATGLVQSFAAAGFVEEARLAEYFFRAGRYVDAVVLRSLAADFDSAPVQGQAAVAPPAADAGPGVNG